MQASIIIPTCNRADQLFRCLNSLVALDFACVDYEIIVIDNGSKDNTNEVVSGYVNEHPKHIIRYFYDNIPGLLTGRHRGAKEAKSEILVFVDDDIHADKGWLTAIVDTFNRFPDVHLVGGKCLPKYETEPPTWLKYFWYSLPDGAKVLGDLSLCDFGEIEKEVHPTWVFGLNFSIRKKSLYELGGFHPDCISPLFQHFQGDGETGLSLKALKNGFKSFYNPKVLVYHEVPVERMTLGYFDKRYFYQGICNSYTELRQNDGFESVVSTNSIKRKIKKFLRLMYRSAFPNPKLSIQGETNFEKEMLKVRFRSFERAGYNFHQEMARNNLVVLKWVLKKDYWDYSIPGFTSDENNVSSK